MPTALTQPRQFGWQAIQLNFIGRLRSSRVTPACAELPSVVTDAGQCDTKGGGARAPSREIEATSRASIWFLPQSPVTRAVAMAPVQREMILSFTAL